MPDGEPRFESSVEQRWMIAERFFAAVEVGDTDALADLLAADVVMYGDGGGKAPARRSPVRGAVAAARLLVGLGRRVRDNHMVMTMVDVNGKPGAIAHDEAGDIVAVLSLDIVEGRVHALRAVVNPDKLAHLSPRHAS